MEEIFEKIVMIYHKDREVRFKCITFPAKSQNQEVNFKCKINLNYSASNIKNKNKDKTVPELQNKR